MKYQYSVSVVCPLSPRQDSGWHSDRYPTMSGAERRAIRGGRLARKMEPVIEGHYLYSGSSPPRVGDFDLISYRVEHAGEDFQAQVLLVA